MKKTVSILLTFVMVIGFAFSAMAAETKETKASERTFLTHEDWAPDVKDNVNSFLELYGKGGEKYYGTEYAVFDFDNTCSIFDVEEQLAVYQMQTMTFAIEPDALADVLFTEIGDHKEDRTDLGYGKGSYADWVDDITKAYKYLYKTYGPFTANGLDAKAQKEIQADPQWQGFATKMRAMYDLVYDAESASVAYPWVLYWFTGMTEQEVYDLAFASHSFYKIRKLRLHLFPCFPMLPPCLTVLRLFHCLSQREHITSRIALQFPRSIHRNCRWNPFSFPWAAALSVPVLRLFCRLWR